MPKLSTNQQASLEALKAAVGEGCELVSKGVWKKACPEGVSVHPGAMVKTGSVVAVKAGVSTNGKITELYRPA